MPKYKNNYLTQVLIRVDFTEPCNDLINIIKPNLQKAILDMFPVPQISRAQGFQVKIDNGVPSDSGITEKTIWTYFSREKDRNCVLDDESLTISFSRYSTYEEFKDIAKKVFIALKDNYAVNFRRIGFRYINEIQILNDNNPLDWEDYIEKDLTNIFVLDKEALTRSMNISEYNYGEYNIKFQFGMYNPDYPAIIKKKIFVLDYDAYQEGLIESVVEIDNFMDDTNKKICELFEKSITQNLKNIMIEV